MPEEQEDNDGNGEDYFNQGGFKRIDGALDQVRSIVNRDDFHPVGQARSEFFDPLFNIVNHVEGILPLTHNDDA